MSGERLKSCYDSAPARVKQYLAAELEFVSRHIRPGDTVLELGVGYGRVALRLSERAARVFGVDTSLDSLALGRARAGADTRCRFLPMDASRLAFRDGLFDVAACVQNGVCAFGTDPEQLVREALRVLRPGGLALFSSYAAEFWPERLRWFETQASLGLVGPIDHERTVEGTIVCSDGLRLGTFDEESFREVCAPIGVEPRITTVDDSSLFCEVLKPA
ncbi:MAG: class I SAM-dependent methyltransferase [Bacteroidota bacterium]